MTLMQNDWNAIREHYKRVTPRIMAEIQCEWGIDAYEWDGVIFLTPIETWLWADIRECNAIFYPQYPVSRFFVDFANPKAKVAIECDGHAYHLDKAKDAARDRELEALGWTVYRFPGHVCRTESDEETGAVGESYRRMRQIVDRHMLSRDHIPEFIELNRMRMAAL